MSLCVPYVWLDDWCCPFLQEVLPFSTEESIWLAKQKILAAVPKVTIDIMYILYYGTVLKLFQSNGMT